MPHAPGTGLGPYEIGAPIGKGGMGDVYRARDAKLDRQVAVKVLPEELANDEERLARFEREAKLLAALNHPNIASIYGLEESDGIKALVLEPVEGPTLAERIVEGVLRASAAAAANFAVTDSGTLFYVTEGSASKALLSWVDRTGRVERIDTMPADA